MEPRSFAAWLCLLGVVVMRNAGPVQGNGSPQLPLASFQDANGDWHLERVNDLGESRRGLIERRRKRSQDQVKLVQDEVKVWPMPVSLKHGRGALSLDRKQFSFEVSEGSAVPDTLTQAFSRYSDIIFGQHFSNSASPLARTLVKLVVTLGSLDEELQYGVDESYKLDIPDSSRENVAHLAAPTVYGALRGLETFSQLATFSFESKSVQINRTPYIIEDFPRFPYRGLLVDTARHYQPISSIKRILDSMAHSKLNVLHWHIVDEQSFPLEIPSYPSLWKGAYSYAERYTLDDAREIVRYARLRGINVMPEVDMPGHTASWGVGYPDLWPSPDCLMPLDVSKNITFDVINGIFQDFKSVFPFKFAHLGGDEVNMDCWTQTHHIRSWLIHNNFTTKDAYADFVTRAQDIALNHGFEPVNWEETFYSFPSKLRNKTVVHNWLNGGTCQKAVKLGFRCIMSDQAFWYLDHLDAAWHGFYNTEPLHNITDAHERSLVIGGEVCMWGETADASNVMQTIWPRAAAAAERLWSAFNVTKHGHKRAVQRLQHFRCLLNKRGIAAAPVLEGSEYYYFGRASPTEPGPCFEQ
ncbi:hypothetical protein M758_7G086900 [Ceratodon purpureus]|nr:hypothetical protein M758_7G086900 [Ceratodon purpureus]